MGKGDKKTRKGKIASGTYGASRPRKVSKQDKTKTKTSESTANKR